MSLAIELRQEKFEGASTSAIIEKEAMSLTLWNQNVHEHQLDDIGEDEED